MTRENLMTIVGTNLKFYRTMRHMTQEELAEKAGVSISFCANIERGKKGVSMFVLRDFADALGITVNQLLYDCNTNQQISNIMVLLPGQIDGLFELARASDQHSQRRFFQKRIVYIKSMFLG